jgi:hypothetical protein
MGQLRVAGRVEIPNDKFFRVYSGSRSEYPQPRRSIKNAAK